MADNTARARKELEGFRASIAKHVEKWKQYPAQQDKDFAVKTINRDQGEIEKIKAKHPSLNSSSWEDTWSPR